MLMMMMGDVAYDDDDDDDDYAYYDWMVSKFLPRVKAFLDPAEVGL